MGDVLSLAKKMERALRNGTGFNVSSDEIGVLAELGIFQTVTQKKIEELQARCPVKIAPTSSETSGSTNDATANHLMSGRPLPTGKEVARSYISALSAGA